MSSNECQYCSNEDMHWTFKDKEDKIAFGVNMEQHSMKFTFQWGDQENLKIYWSGFMHDLKYCPFCGRKILEER